MGRPPMLTAGVRTKRKKDRGGGTTRQAERGTDPHRDEPSRSSVQRRIRQRRTATQPLRTGWAGRPESPNRDTATVGRMRRRRGGVERISCGNSGPPQRRWDHSRPETIDAHPSSRPKPNGKPVKPKKKPPEDRWLEVIGPGGLEPPTPAVSGRCSPTELRAFKLRCVLGSGTPPRTGPATLMGPQTVRQSLAQI